MFMNVCLSMSLDPLDKGSYEPLDVGARSQTPVI